MAENKGPVYDPQESLLGGIVLVIFLIAAGAVICGIYKFFNP